MIWYKFKKLIFCIRWFTFIDVEYHFNCTPKIANNLGG